MPILANGEERKASVSNVRELTMGGTARHALIWCVTVARILPFWTVTVPTDIRTYGEGKSVWNGIIS